MAADSIFKICNRMYHVECQSNPDGTIAVRMLEYDFYIAMRNVAKDEQGKYTVEFPKSAVLYLPFYLLRYEKDVEEIEANEEKLETIVEEYRGLIEKLDEIYKLSDDTTQRLIREVERQMKGIVEYTFKQEKEARNKLGGAIMGGTVMKTVEEEIEELKKTIKEKEVALEQAMAEKEDTIKEREDTIKEKEAALAEAMAEIERLKNQNAG